MGDGACQMGSLARTSAISGGNTGAMCLKHCSAVACANTSDVTPMESPADGIASKSTRKTDDKYSCILSWKPEEHCATMRIHAEAVQHGDFVMERSALQKFDGLVHADEAVAIEVKERKRR